MPATPSSTLSTLRPDLAAFFEFDLEMQKRGYVATRVLPVVETALQADNPGKIPLESLLFQGDTKRNSASGYNRGSFKFETFLLGHGDALVGRQGTRVAAMIEPCPIGGNGSGAYSAGSLWWVGAWRQVWDKRCDGCARNR